ncbi:AbrB/MazE/SpoVT family DNA-binding domain-containing protein [Sphingomonas sp.]|uniref:AbrB/MazE/SpoVT family DNA-binding domain-containing protein n=1 Tax=Sphingomonas sp. TaxID=28214 RepID=UPI003B00BA26
MGNEYKAKVFKSGNSVALRLPKALGLKEGMEMTVREEHGSFIVEPSMPSSEYIDLTGIYGSVPGIRRPPAVDSPREWEAVARDA